MEQLFGEIRAAVANHAWLLALFGILAIPDICAALGSANGETTGAKYKAWFETNLGAGYPNLDADEMYKLRCSMLHQGASATETYSRIIFVAPNRGMVFHNNVINDALNLDMGIFSEDLISAASSWLASNAGAEPVRSNIEHLIRWYPDGLAPYFGGIPVLT